MQRIDSRSADVEVTSPNPEAVSAVDKRGRYRRARRGEPINLRKLALLNAERLLLLVVLLAAWEAVVVAGWIDEFFVSRPTQIAGALGDLLRDTTFYSAHLRLTVQETLYGLGIGTLAGLLTGIVFGMRPKIYEMLEPLVMTMYTIPRLALAPLFVLWFGLGQASKVALAVSLVYFVMLINAFTAVRRVDPDLVAAVRQMGGRTATIVREIYLPSIIPWLLAGLKISLAFSLTGAIVGEMIASQAGIGNLLASRATYFDTEGIFALLAVVAAVAWILTGVISALERRYAFWGKTAEEVQPMVARV